MPSPTWWWASCFRSLMAARLVETCLASLADWVIHYGWRPSLRNETFSIFQKRPIRTISRLQFAFLLTWQKWYEVAVTIPLSRQTVLDIVFCCCCTNLMCFGCSNELRTPTTRPASATVHHPTPRAFCEDFSDWWHLRPVVFCKWFTTAEVSWCTSIFLVIVRYFCLLLAKTRAGVGHFGNGCHSIPKFGWTTCQPPF